MRTPNITSIALCYNVRGILLGGYMTVRISRSYSQEMMWLVLGDLHPHVPHEVFLRGKRYLKITLHFLRKI